MSASLRHAYLIMAHGNFPILEKQLRFLDSENADFFIHIDAKVRDFDFDRFRAVPARSRVTFVDRIRVSWGHYSQVECELILLKAALPGHYDYYHLLSGVDVPVKTRSQIEEYFTRAPGVNYLHCQHAVPGREYTDRLRYYYPVQRINIQNRAVRTAIRRACQYAQAAVGVDRIRKNNPDMVIQKGANWFSITHALAEYAVSREDWIRQTFHSGFCCDEIFLQTLVMNSDFKDTLSPQTFSDDHRPCLRYIDWARGKPYTFGDGDYDELIHTPPDYLFARKFDYARSPGVVDALFDHFGE